MNRDIKHTLDGDIDLTSGDVETQESTFQHQKDILLSDKGYYKESPTVGVNAAEYIHDTDPANLFRAIRREMTKDGMSVKEISADNKGLIIDAEYENSNS